MHAALNAQRAARSMHHPPHGTPHTAYTNAPDNLSRLPPANTIPQCLPCAHPNHQRGASATQPRCVARAHVFAAREKRMGWATRRAMRMLPLHHGGVRDVHRPVVVVVIVIFHRARLHVRLQWRMRLRAPWYPLCGRVPAPTLVHVPRSQGTAVALTAGECAAVAAHGL